MDASHLYGVLTRTTCFQVLQDGFEPFLEVSASKRVDVDDLSLAEAVRMHGNGRCTPGKRTTSSHKGECEEREIPPLRTRATENNEGAQSLQKRGETKDPRIVE